jgi:hypothetical protein
MATTLVLTLEQNNYEFRMLPSLSSGTCLCRARATEDLFVILNPIGLRLDLLCKEELKGDELCAI